MYKTKQFSNTCNITFLLPQIDYSISILCSKSVSKKHYKFYWHQNRVENSVTLIEIKSRETQLKWGKKLRIFFLIFCFKIIFFKIFVWGFEIFNVKMCFSFSHIVMNINIISYTLFNSLDIHLFISFLYFPHLILWSRCVSSEENKASSVQWLKLEI